MELQVSEKNRTYKVIWQAGDRQEKATLVLRPILPIKQVREGRLELLETSEDDGREILVHYSKNPQFLKLPENLGQTTYELCLYQWDGDETILRARKTMYLGSEMKIRMNAEVYSDQFTRLCFFCPVLIPRDLFWLEFTASPGLNERFHLPAMKKTDDGEWQTACLIESGAFRERRLHPVFHENIRDYVSLMQP